MGKTKKILELELYGRERNKIKHVINDNQNKKTPKMMISVKLLWKNCILSQSVGCLFPFNSTQIYTFLSLLCHGNLGILEVSSE